MTLRRFLYLDSGAVGDYLSAVLGGVPDGTISTTDKDTRGISAGGKVGPAELRGSRDDQLEERRSLRVTDEARFQQLYSMLENGKEIQPLGAFDPAIVGDFKRGEVVEIDAEVQVGELHTILAASSQMAGWLDLAEQWGLDLELDDDGEMDARTMLQSMDQLSQQVSGQPIPITFSALGTPEVAFGALLRRGDIRVDLSELEGEVVVFGTVHRVVSTGDSHVLWSPIGALSSLVQQTGNRAERRRAEKAGASLDASQSGDQMGVEIVGPGVIVTPVAIFL